MSLNSKQPMLEGVRVVDLTSVVLGPYATQMLADLGADVIKVEPLQGDSFRYSGKWPKTRGMSPGHISINRGKRSVALDMKTEDDVQLVRELIAGADVFVHNVRARGKRLLGALIGQLLAPPCNPS